jgi:hypothetical protein
MSDEVERDLKEFRGLFPRPGVDVTRDVERRVLARPSTSDVRRRRIAPFAATAAIALAVGSALGAGVVAGAGAATDRVTITVRPVLTADGSATAFGAVSNASAGEDVAFEIRECGSSSFRTVAGTTTSNGGAFSYPIWLNVNAAVRAHWRGAVSDSVEVRRRVAVGLYQRSGKRFRVNVGAVEKFEGRRAVIERWDRARGRWILLRQVTLRGGYAPAGMWPGGFGGGGVGAGNHVQLKVPRGVRLRARVTDAQARPCYVGGVSTIITTR